MKQNKAYPLENLSIMGMKKRLSPSPQCFSECNCNDEKYTKHCDCGHDGNDDSGCVKCFWHYLKRIK